MTITRDPACREMLEQISAYLDGDLDAPACDAIERHCGTCAECAAFVEGLRSTVGLCRQAGSAPLPPGVRDRARAAMQRLLDDDSPPSAGLPTR